MTNVKLLFLRVNNSLQSRYKTFLVNQRAQRKRYRSQFMNLGYPKVVIWIFGCQRSGTTFLENIFRQDLDSVVFGEFSQLTISPDKTVLSDLETVHEIVESQNAKYAVIRPLFESDRAADLLNLFPNSVGVWLFRDCPHVVNSMIRKWGGNFFERSREVESDQRGMWRLEETNQSLSVAAQIAVPNDPLAEMYARFWLARNLIPFHTSLHQDRRMVFMSYHQLVSSPHGNMEKLLKKAGMPGVWQDFNPDADTSGLERSVDLMITEETRAGYTDWMRDEK
jgi:hypothetical protein